MKNLLLILLIFTVCFSCLNHNRQNQKNQNNAEKNSVSEPVIGMKNVINEVAGSAYLNKAICYFVIANQDTSGFMPVFTESKDAGVVGIDLNLPYSNKSETYHQRIMELKLILNEAGKEFNFDSLRSMSVGRLILTGDLAVDITREYKNQFGEKEKITTADYSKISDFLLNSGLTKDINELFEPYSKSVENVSIEKAFFITKEELFKVANVSEDIADVPDHILDCITWVRLKKE